MSFSVFEHVDEIKKSSPWRRKDRTVLKREDREPAFKAMLSVCAVI